MTDLTPTGPFNIPGCTDERAINYDPKATEDNNTCNYGNTTDPVIDNTINCDNVSEKYKFIIIGILAIFIIILGYIYYTYIKDLKPESKKISEDSFVLQFN